MELKRHDLIVLSRLLYMTGEQFSTHSCGDLPDGFLSGLTGDERYELLEQVRKYTGLSKDELEDIEDVEDHVLMSFYSEYLEQALLGTDETDETEVTNEDTVPTQSTLKILMIPGERGKFSVNKATGTIQHIGYGPSEYIISTHHTPYDCFLLSEDETIRPGDWYYDRVEGRVKRAVQSRGANDDLVYSTEGSVERKNALRVVATSNRTVAEDCEELNEMFIQDVIRHYNRGKKLISVDVTFRSTDENNNLKCAINPVDLPCGPCLCGNGQCYAKKYRKIYWDRYYINTI